MSNAPVATGPTTAWQWMPSRSASKEIGKQAKRITSDTLGAMPDVDWPNVKGMRDVIAHDYLDVQVEVVIDVVRDDLPGLRRAACTALGVFGDRRQR